MTSLPHDASIDDEGETISISLGPVTLNFTFEEWESFVIMIDDINAVFQSNLQTLVHQCSTCGTINSTVEYVEPEEDEFN
tara:strand:- start:771 stop:1010 length:240 start_codon:yes stop_codon:yes gene_type:complete